MKKPKRLPGPLRKPCRIHSTTGSGDLLQLDWANWWIDNLCGHFYIHVRMDGHPPFDATWHRVYPKGIKGRVCNRISVVDGEPHWLYDKK